MYSLEKWKQASKYKKVSTNEIDENITIGNKSPLADVFNYVCIIGQCICEKR